MKIVQVTHSCSPEFAGGAVIYCYELADSLRAGNNVRIFCGEAIPDGCQSSRERRSWKDIDLTVQPITRNELDRPFARYGSLRNARIDAAFKRYLLHEKPDVVHFHYLLYLPASLILVARKLRIPTVLTVHDGSWFCPAFFFLKKDTKKKCEQNDFVRCAYCLAKHEKQGTVSSFIKNLPFLLFRRYYIARIFNAVSRVISPSEYMAEKYVAARFLKEKIRIIPNGILQEPLGPAARKVDPHNVRLGFLSGTSEWKGYQVLIAAIAKLTLHNCTFHIWGAYDQSIVDQTQGAAGKSNLVFHGPYSRTQTMEVLSGIDVLLFPSLFEENCPLTILEAQSQKVPIIATNIGGIPELIHNNVDGILFEQNNARELSEAINRLLEKPDLISSMSLQIRKTKTIQEQSIEIENIYKELLKLS